MPARTNSDKIDDLIRSVAMLEERVAAMDRRVEEIAAAVKENRTATDAIIHRVVTVETTMKDLIVSHSTWKDRSWQILLAFITAQIGGVIGYALRG